MNLIDFMTEEAAIAEKKERKFRELCDIVVKPIERITENTTVLPNECPYCGDLKHPCRCYEFGGM